MPRFERKVLWAVQMPNTAIENRIKVHAVTAGCTAVCIRTTSPILAAAIGRFHTAGLKVYGWRWPAVRPPTSSPHHLAMDEANHVATVLIPRGLDGYIADPESDTAGAKDDWDNASLAPLARNYCGVIKAAAAAAGFTAFAFGTTSGCRFPNVKPNIPWREFVRASDTLFPQCYWRAKLSGGVTPINGGTPNAAIGRGMTSWGTISGPKPIVPMAGELEHITPAEIATYAAKVVSLGLDQFHFYADGSAISAAKLAAIRAI